MVNLELLGFIKRSFTITELQLININRKLISDYFFLLCILSESLPEDHMKGS